MYGRSSSTAVVLAAGLLLCLFACAYVPTRSLEYQPVPSEVHVERTGFVAVRSLTEARREREYHAGLVHGFKTYAPLLPYVRVPYERLDESDLKHRSRRGTPIEGAGHFTVLFGQAIAQDLSRSGLFETVEYIGNEAPPESADLILEGDLESTEFNVTWTSYMLGAAGVMLWLLPIPVGSNSATVEINLRLRDRSGQELWSHRIASKESKWFTLYNSWGEPVSSHFALEIKRYGKNKRGIDGDSLWAYHAAALRSGMAGAKRSLAEYLSSRD